MQQFAGRSLAYSPIVEPEEGEQYILIETSWLPPV